MATLNNTAYIKKLVKIVYEKEKQIQAMKRVLKEKQPNIDDEHLSSEIHPALKRELECTSGQLREVSLQMLSMEEKMTALSNGLEDEIAKNNKLAQENHELIKLNRQHQQKIKKMTNEVEEYQGRIKQMTQQIASLEENLLELTKQGESLHEKIKGLKQIQQRQKIALIRYETEVSEYKLQIRKQTSQYKAKQGELASKNFENDSLKSKLINTQAQIDRLTAESERVKENFLKLTNQYNELKVQHENREDAYNIKESQFNMLSETLKDYEEFAFEISQYIESAYMKHCCQGMLRTSKKLIKEADSCTTRFQAAFCKLNQLQMWMDSTAEKLQKLIRQYELPNETLENLSIIAHSFQEKLELCDLTERIEKEKQEMDKNEQLLLDNLQREIQKSKLIEKSKLVELDEVKEILKVTKEINRELMDEINGKEYILSQCRKFYAQVIGSKSNPEFKNLKSLLNLKQ